MCTAYVSDGVPHSLSAYDSKTPKHCRFCMGIRAGNMPEPSYASVLVCGSANKEALSELLLQTESSGFISSLTIMCLPCRRISLICQEMPIMSAELAHLCVWGTRRRELYVGVAVTQE
jgi:hypothetical protein